MTTALRHKIFSWSQTIGLGLLCVFFLLFSAPEIGNDTGSYSSFNITRPPVYPIFLWLFHSFGSYQYVVVMWAQSILCFSALIYAKNWLKKNLNISDMLIFPILLFTILQVFFHFKMLQLIYSEAVAFPLFIITFFLLMDCFKTTSNKHFLLLMICTALLVSTRAQFYYFYGLLAFLIAWYIWKKLPAKQLVLKTIIIIFSIFFTLVLNRGYHFLMNGYFGEIPVTGKQIVIQPLFLTTSSAIKYFNDPAEKQIFAIIMQQVEQQQITKNSAPSAMLPPLALPMAYEFYNTAYVPITQVVSKTFLTYSPVDTDKILLHMSKTLFLHELKDNLAFYYWKVSSFFGDSCIFLSIILILIALSTHLLKRNGTNMNDLFIFISLITILLNTAFVAIPEVVTPRYSYYSYFLIYCLGSVLADYYFSKKQPLFENKAHITCVE